MNRHSSGTHSAGADAVEPQSALACEIIDFVREGIDLESRTVQAKEDPFWRPLSELGTELWLADGNETAVDADWNSLFAALVVDTDPLTAEIQQGSFDDWIGRTRKLLNSLDEHHQVRETARILHARHALRQVDRLGCRAVVPLRAEADRDVGATIREARRLHAMGPEHLVVSIPFTPAGIVATRKVREEGIPVYCAMGFSARQNYVATALANPSYVDIGVGTLNAFVRDNGLGDGQRVGEKAALAGQQEVKVFALALPQSQTRLVATAFDDPKQLSRIAGVDVFAMSPEMVQQAKQASLKDWASRRRDELTASLAPEVVAESVRLETLWTVTARERKLVEQMILAVPDDPQELILAAREQGVRDLFPELNPDELNRIAADGRVARHHRWADKIARGELAVDSLMTLAGLAHSIEAQRQMDEAIRSKLQAVS